MIVIRGLDPPARPKPLRRGEGPRKPSFRGAESRAYSGLDSGSAPKRAHPGMTVEVVGLPGQARQFTTTHSHDEQVVRVDGHTDLDLRQRDRRGLRSVGAEIQRLVCGIEVEFGTEARELIVA
jgi:hypothetical protein